MTGFPEVFPDLFRRYVGIQPAMDLLASARRLAGIVFDRRAEEYRVVGHHLERHAHDLCRLLAL